MTPSAGEGWLVVVSVEVDLGQAPVGTGDPVEVAELACAPPAGRGARGTYTRSHVDTGAAAHAASQPHRPQRAQRTQAPRPLNPDCNFRQPGPACQPACLRVLPRWRWSLITR
jgi:hypothetical protein